MSQTIDSQSNYDIKHQAGELLVEIIDKYYVQGLAMAASKRYNTATHGPLNLTCRCVETWNQFNILPRKKRLEQDNSNMLNSWAMV